MVGCEGCGYAMLQFTSAPTLDLVTLCNGPVPTHTPSPSPSPCSPPPPPPLPPPAHLPPPPLLLSLPLLTSSSPSPCSPPLFNGLPTAVLYELLRDGEARLQPVALSCLYVLQEDTEQFGGHLHVHPQPVQDHPHHVLWGGRRAAITGRATRHSLTGYTTRHSLTGCTTWHSLTGRATRHSLTGCATRHSLTGRATRHSLTGRTTRHSLTGRTTRHSLTGRATRHSLTGEVCAHTHSTGRRLGTHPHTVRVCGALGMGSHSSSLARGKQILIITHPHHLPPPL